MEMILDAGKDTIESLSKIAKIEDKPLDVVALEMMSLGARVYHASKEKTQENDINMLRNILKTALVNHELLAEIVTIVFNKERSKLKAYDSESAIKIAEQLAEQYLKGGERL
jgi:hypothetical protein